MRLHLTKIAPELNQRRYYHMHIEPGLFGDWGLVREWGRIGRSGQSRTDWFDSEAQAIHRQQQLEASKAKRGYLRLEDAPGGGAHVHSNVRATPLFCGVK